MNRQERMKFFWIGFTLFGAVAVSILFFFFIFKLDTVFAAFETLLGILAPIIYGMAMAYLLAPIYNTFEKKLEPWFSQKVSKKKGTAFAKALSTCITLVLMFAVLTGLFWMVLPEVYNSIIGIIDLIPQSVTQVSAWAKNILENNPETQLMVESYYEEYATYFTTWVTTHVLPNMQEFVTNLSSGIFRILNFLKNFLIGIIVAVYVLNCKTTFATQAKKILYSIFHEKWGSAIIQEIRFVNHVFGGFIIGKIIDSLIIGILCYICLSFMKMPYTMLISVIVGVTNVIPFFGPFIGAIPSFFLLLLVSPIQSLYFLVFVFILQQFDGNILGPKILGDSTGLSSFWVLFSILLFGGLLGFLGMVIGVPFFAVAYHLISQAVNKSLKKKNLSTVTEDYKDIP